MAMKTARFNNNEIKQMFDISDSRHAEAHQVMLSKIELVEHIAQETLTQAKKTNGRVTSVEDDAIKENTKNAVFRARIMTAVIILTFIVGSILIPIIASFIQAGWKL